MHSVVLLGCAVNLDTLEIQADLVLEIPTAQILTSTLYSNH